MAKRFHEGDSFVPSTPGLPTEVIRKPYSEVYKGMPEGLNDGISGIDSKIKGNHEKVRRYGRPENE